MKLLEAKDLTLKFGGLTAINQLSFSVAAGEIVAIIGPNGAGKTSAFNVVSGIYSPTSGCFEVRGSTPLEPLSTWRLVTIMAVGVATGLFLACGLNIQGLWEAAVVNRYRFREPFAWGKAAHALLDSMVALTWHWWAPLIGGVVLGSLGALSTWNRSRCAPERLQQLNISRTFQNIRLFKHLNALENVLVGMHSRLKSGLLTSLLSLPSQRREEREARREAYEILALLGLSAFAHRKASDLPYGHQRRLEIARALASKPQLLLLDEPAAGMNPTEGGELVGLVKSIRDRGIAVLLIDHHMRVVMNLSDRIIVLDYGNKIAEGTPAEIRANPRVIKAYLGEDSAQ